LLLIFLLGGGGGMGFIYLLFLLRGGPTIEERDHFLCCFFVCVGRWHMKGQTACATKHIEKPLFDIMVFLIKIILKIWPLEAIYMCRLLQLKNLKFKKKWCNFDQNSQNVINTL
jgi:hypothetical protein